jgi:hypothetical protein
MSPQPPPPIIIIIQAIQVIIQALILPIKLVAGVVIVMHGIEIQAGEDGDIMVAGVTIVECIVVVRGTAAAGIVVAVGIAVVVSDIAKRWHQVRLANGTGVQSFSTIFISLENTLHYPSSH